MYKQLLFLLLATGPVLSAQAAVPDGTQLIHTWNLESVLIGETPVAPDEALQDDMFTFSADNTFTAVIEGVSYSGTYGVDVSTTWITLYIADDHAERFKIVSLGTEELTVQRFDPDGTIMTFIYQRAD